LPLSIYGFIKKQASCNQRKIFITVDVIRLLQTPLAVLVLLLESPSSVGKPSGYLRQCHLRDDRQHDLLGLGRIRVLPMFEKPRLECIRRLAVSILPANVDDDAGLLTTNAGADADAVRSNTPVATASVYSKRYVVKVSFSTFARY